MTLNNLSNIQDTTIVSIANSSSTPLLANATFTGTAEITNGYGIIYVNVYSDQASATDGLAIEQSIDGTNWEHDDKFTIPANNGKTFSVNPHAKYFRVKYTNGIVNQASFRLQCILKTYGITSCHRIKDAIANDDDSVLVKSCITGIDDNGVFENVGVSLSNRLKVNSQPYTFAIAEGDVLNHTGLLKFGTRTTVAANTNSLVWEGTAALYTYLTSAEQLKVSSASANDTATTGTGARTLTIEGLDGNFAEQTETIDMAGASVVTTTKSFIRIFRAYVATSGALYSNDGIITITNNAGTNQLLVITVGDSQTLMAMWTVPASKTLYLTNASFSTDSNKGARISIRTRILDGGILYPWRIRYRAFVFSGNENFPFTIPFKIDAKTDIEVRVLTPAAAGTTECGATFEGWYEPA